VWRHGSSERCEGACSEHELLLVSAADYDESLGAAHAARVRAARLASAVTPRAGAWQRNRDAFRAQARVALEDFVPGSPASEAPPAGASRDDPDRVIRIHLWPR
jgi:hypothetical protein